MNPESQVGVFSRTPLPSAPAKSCITKIQIALNNFLLQLPDAIYTIAEEALPMNYEGTDSEDVDRISQHLEERCCRLGTLLHSIDSLIDELPDSTRTTEYYTTRIQELEQESQQLSNILREGVDNIKVLHEIVVDEVKECIESLSHPPSDP